MFNIKLEEKSHKMSFEALSAKIKRLKNSQCDPPPPPPIGQIGLSSTVSTVNYQFNTLEEKFMFLLM